MTPRNPLVAIALGLAFVIGLFVAYVVVSTPLDYSQDSLLGFEPQLVFGLLSVLGVYFLGRMRGRLVITILTVVSLIFVSRYLWWRMTETLDFKDWLAGFLGYGLFMAELYLWVALLVTYVQSAWPLGRKPVELPDDMSLWPTVDVLIPTFNEDISIVSKTVLAAKSMEYPADKLKVYILDDGSRPEFRDFARDVGVGYITREDNAFAKAGNLNNAIGETDGELVAVFDCDHIPTRWFLQLTAGWFLKEPNMAFIQTPHHFYNHDPFLKNLSAGDKVPPEGLLFYGLVQDGNDFWNASFFCGSCALMRRAAIEEVGGFATETVTEDAETALKMHRRGWQSGFIRVPMAAGLATETLGRFIQQRIRWARGMVQILRIDNPLLGPGLTLPQRLCYLSAMMHFLFPLPRFVLLTAPLAFLLMDVRIITSSAYEVFVNALPYLLIVIYVNWRIQGRYRHVFWSDVYETSLTLHLLWPTVKTFLFPKGGKFNVTSKGGSTEETYFDTRLMVWHMLLGLVLIFGIAMGIYNVASGAIDENEMGTAALNLFWALVSLIYVGASLAVARELQHEPDHRVLAEMPAAVRLPDGRTVAGTTIDLSESDLRLDMEMPEDVEGSAIHVEVDAASDRIMLPAEIVDWDNRTLTARFTPQSVEQHQDLVRLVFGRGDAWIDWDRTHAEATPLQSAGEIFGSIGSFMKWSGGRFGKSLSKKPGKGQAGGDDGGKRSPKKVLESAMKGSAQQTNLLVGALAIGLLTLFGPDYAQAQRPVPAPTQQNDSADDVSAEEVEEDLEFVEEGATGIPPSEGGVPDSPFFGQSDLTFGQPADTLTGTETVPTAGFGDTPALVRTPGGDVPTTPKTHLLTFQELGTEPSMLFYNGNVRGIPFQIRRDEVVTDATLTLNLTYSPSLIAGKSHLVILVNGEGVETIDLDPSFGTTRTINMQVDPVLLKSNNEILIEFVGEGISGNPECPNDIDESVWVRIGHQSRIAFNVSRFRLRNDLSELPAPFFDPSDPTRLELPFVLPGNPSLETLRASAVAASHWGKLADYRGASFPVYLNDVPADNAVVFARPNAVPPGIELPPVSGPTLSIIDNPVSPSTKLLLVLGRTDVELVAAAQALATGTLAIRGSTVPVSSPALAPRSEYDAPAWLPTDRIVNFGDMVPPNTLEHRGVGKGVVSFNFRAAPDVFLWAREGVPVTVRYRFPPGRYIDHESSRLDVLINDEYITSLDLKRGAARDVADQVFLADYVQAEGSLVIPPNLILGQNRLQFFWDLKPVQQGECVQNIPADVRAVIDANSTIDMRGVNRMAKMPNLAFLTQAGFPFTRMADLSETAFVMPDNYESHDIEALLAAAGLMGARTGMAGYQLQVIAADMIDAAIDKDVFLIGTWENQRLLNSWSDYLPFEREGNAIIVPATSPSRTGTGSMSSWFTDNEPEGSVRMETAQMQAGLISFQSPLSDSRTVVALLEQDEEDVKDVVNALTDPDLAAKVQADFVMVSGEQVTSYEVAEKRYEIGNLPFWVWAQYYVSDKPIALIILVMFAALLLGYPIFTWLRSSAASKTQKR